MPPPIPSMPYAPKSLYTPRYADNIAQLLTRQGDIQAAGAARSGEIWGNFARDIGQIGGQAVQAYGEQQAQKKQEEIRAKREEAFTSIIQTWDAKDPIGFTKRLTSAVGPMEAMKFTGAMLSFEDVIRKNQKGEMPTIEEVKQGILGVDILTKNAPGEFEKQYPMLREQYGPAIKEYFGGYELPEVPTPEVVSGLRALAQQIGAKGGASDNKVVGGALVTPEGKVIYQAPDKPVPPGNPEPVTINGRPTMATPAEIAEAKAQGASVSPYAAPQVDVEGRQIRAEERKAAMAEEKKKTEAVVAAKEVKGQVDSAFAAMDSALKELESYSGVKAVTSPLEAKNARQQYEASTNAFAATLSRATGDSRISDRDRAAYAGLVAYAGPGSGLLNVTRPDLARKRFENAKKFFKESTKVRMEAAGGTNEEPPDAR